MQFRTWLVACSAGLMVLGCAAPEPDNAGSHTAAAATADRSATSSNTGNASASGPGVNERMVERGGPTWAFRTGNITLPAITYQFDGRTYTLDDYLNRRNIKSLVIVKDGQLVFERYLMGHKPEDRFVSYSVAKSITSLLVGVALDKGLIKSIDDTAETYAPELAGSAYGQTTIRNLLQMASGVQWSENYNGRDDIADLWNSIFGTRGAGNPTDVLTRRRKQKAPQGTQFQYSTGETQVLCHVLRGAGGGKTVAEMTQEWLWQPLGAEDSAAWQVGADGLEYCGGGFIARTRDYARIARLVSDVGARDGTQILPHEYVLQATEGELQRKGFRIGDPGPGFGYGYQFWLGPLGSAMIGVYGQYVGIYRPQNLLIVQTASWPRSTSPAWTRERSAFTSAIAKAFAQD